MSEEKKKKLFSKGDFDKVISVGDQLVFDKSDLKVIKVDLIWAGTDLDVCAFLLGEDNLMNERADLVYFKSERRWMPEFPIDDHNFNPLKGRVSGTWKEGGFKNPLKWMNATLPLSGDNAVIGSWDDMAEEDDDSDCGETLHVLLDEVDVSVHSTIVFAAVVAKEKIEKGEHFEDAHDPIVRIYDAEKDELIAEYKLADKFPGKDAVCFGRMVYDADKILWSFEPMDESYTGGLEYLATQIYG